MPIDWSSPQGSPTPAPPAPSGGIDWGKIAPSPTIKPTGGVRISKAEGAYNLGPGPIPGQSLVNTGHTTYGGLPGKTGFQRNDIIPTSLGGSNSTPQNVEYQPLAEAHARDKVETYLAQQVKAGKLSLQAARGQALNWKSVNVPGVGSYTKPATTASEFGSAVGDTLGSIGRGIKNFFTPKGTPNKISGSPVGQFTGFDSGKKLVAPVGQGLTPAQTAAAQKAVRQPPPQMIGPADPRTAITNAAKRLFSQGILGDPSENQLSIAANLYKQAETTKDPAQKANFTAQAKQAQTNAVTNLAMSFALGNSGDLEEITPAGARRLPAGTQPSTPKLPENIPPTAASDLKVIKNFDLTRTKNIPDLIQKVKQVLPHLQNPQVKEAIDNLHTQLIKGELGKTHVTTGSNASFLDKQTGKGIQSITPLTNEEAAAKLSNNHLGITPADNLPPEHAAIQNRAIEHATTNTDKLYNDYHQKFDGVLNTDSARELFPDYNASKEARSAYSAAVHEPSSALIKEFYKRDLATKQGEGNNTVVFTAGGTGSGKTSAVESNIGKVYSDSPIKYDTNLANFDSATKKIDQAIASGYKVDIAYVYRDPVESLTQGALTRAENPNSSVFGRTVPIEEHLKTHIDSNKVIRQLVDHYKADPHVQFNIIDNSRGQGGAVQVPLDQIPKIRYTPQVLRERLLAALNKEYEQGRISKSTYEGTLQRRGLTAQAELPKTRPRVSGQPEPQRAVGKSAGSQVIDKAYQSIHENGGVTINLGGKIPDEGFAYAPAKGTEFSIPNEQFTPSHVEEFARKNIDLLSKPGNYIGGWVNEGMTYLDVSRVGEPSAATIKEAQDAKQLAVFDLKNFQDVPTGQITNGVYTPLDEASNVYAQYQGEIAGANSSGGVASNAEIPISREGTASLPETGATPESGVTLHAGFNPGVDKFIAEDVKPTVGKIKEAAQAVGGLFRGAIDAIRNTFQPINPLNKAFGKEAGAGPIQAISTPEAESIAFDHQKSVVFDKNFRELTQFFNKFSEEDLRNFNLTRGNPSSGEALTIQDQARTDLNPKLNDPNLMAAIKDASDYVFNFAKDNGLDLNYFEDYFYGAYKNPEAVSKFLDYWQSTDKYTKEKVFPTIADASAFGLELKDQNPIANIKSEMVAVAQRVGLVRLRNQIEKEQPSYAVSTEQATRDQLVGWEKINDPVFKDMLFDPKYAKVVNNLISTNKVNGNKILGAIRKTTFLAQQIKFVGSIFHMGNELKAAVSSEYGGVANPKGITDFIKSFKKLDETTPEYKDYVLNGGGHKYSIESQAQTAFTENLDRIGRGNFIGAALRVPKVIAQQKWIPASPGFIKFMFDDFIPTLKFNKYSEEVASKQNSLGRTLTAGEKQEIIKTNQNFYGEMNERLFGRSGTVTSALRLVFQAPGYGEGNFRALFSGLTGNVKAINFVMTSLVTTLIAATIGTIVLTRKAPPVPKSANDIRDLFKVRTNMKDGNGDQVFFDLMTYDKDFWSVVGNAATGQFSKIPGAIQARITGAVSTPQRVLTDMSTLFNGGMVYDYKAQPIYYKTDSPITKFNKFLSYEGNTASPISVSTFEASKKKGQATATAIGSAVTGIRPTNSEDVKDTKAAITDLYSLQDAKRNKQIELNTMAATNPDGATAEAKKFNTDQENKLFAILKKHGVQNITGASYDKFTISNLNPKPPKQGTNIQSAL